MRFWKSFFVFILKKVENLVLQAKAMITCDKRKQSKITVDFFATKSNVLISALNVKTFSRQWCQETKVRL